MSSPTDLNEIEEQLVVAFAADGVGSTLVAARLTHHPNRDIVDAAVAVVVDGVVHSVHASARADGREAGADTAIGPLAFAIDPDAPDAIVITVDGFGISGTIRFTPWPGPAASLHWDEPPPFPAAITDHRHPGGAGGDLVVHGQAVPVPSLGVAWRRSGSVTAPDLIHALGRAPLVELPDRFGWDLTIVPEGADGTSGDPEEPAIVVERDTDGEADVLPRWIPRTRWIDGATVVTDTGAEFELAVAARIPLRALGIDHPHWTPGRWHDEIAYGGESGAVADLDPTDVRNLRTLNAVRITDPDGHPIGVGLLDLVAYGDHPDIGLRGFADGWGG